MQRATTLAGIKRVLDPRPLRLDELDGFFVETSDARDPFVARRDQIAEIFDGEDDAKVLLVGHSGTDKTAELVKLRMQAQALLEYNGEQWHRVHPLVAEHLKE
jgi:hypothetical protein